MADTPPLTTRPTSRPLSEISENEDIRRVSARVSSYSLKTISVSRPGSEVREDTKRLSMPVHTITLNLADYTGTAPAKTVPPSTAVTVTTATPSSSFLNSAAPPSSSRKPTPPKPEKPAELTGKPIQDIVVDLSEPADGVSPLFMATRAALKPTGGDILEKDLTPSPSGSIASLDSPRSSSEMAKWGARSTKPKWLRRASMTPMLRSTSKSPAMSLSDLPPEPSSPRMSTSAPPPLPPRRFPAGPLDTSPTAGPSRPPLHPGRDSSQARRWGMGVGVTRSASNNSLASTASSAHQRLPASAQRVLGHAGNAVSKTWLRARGVGGSMSISNLGALAQVRGVEPEPTSPGPLARKLSRDTATPPPQEPPIWGEGVVKRAARKNYPRGLVFGQQLDVAGRTWGVFDAASDREDEEEYHQRRRRCLPAIVIRCVDYLNIWGPQEEGVFRISGRSSHINRLRRDFDAGADLDLTLCEPADLDPHAIASIFKSFIRELPEPMLPPYVENKLDEYLHKSKDVDVDELVALISTLPSANWFLLADVVGLIDLIPRHSAVNRMTTNALMISLGPTLRLSGDHVSLLVRHREQLFADPPLVSAADLIDFGSDDEIALSPVYDDVQLPAPIPIPAPSKPRPMSRISKRPSFGNLLSRSSNSSMRRSQSEMGLSVSPAPPRLALPEAVQVALPSFGGSLPSHAHGIAEEMESIDESPFAKSTETLEEAHYPTGTVAARTRVFSTPTPIADRFRRSSNLQHELRPPSDLASSASSFVSDNSFQSNELPIPSNPISSLRRSPPLFFQSTAAGSSPPATRAGTKRKDDTGADRSSDTEAPGGAKRLSSGPSLDEY